MKPRTRIQQEVARLSKRLPKLTEEQKAYAFRHCFKHYAVKRANGTNICTECGHSWKSDHDLADAPASVAVWGWKRCAPERAFSAIWSISPLSPPANSTKWYVSSSSIPDTRQDRTVCRVFHLWGGAEVDCPQRQDNDRCPTAWNVFILLWQYSDMEVRKKQENRAYDITPRCSYPRQRFIPEVKRNGFKGEYHKILPYDLFKGIHLSQNKFSYTTPKFVYQQTCLPNCHKKKYFWHTDVIIQILLWFGAIFVIFKI